MENNVEKYKAHKRSDEIQDIIERMPSKFGFWVTVIVLAVFSLLFIFGWIVRYPDIVTGGITINANKAPVKLVANTFGSIKLTRKKSMDKVHKDEVIGYIQNPAELSGVLFIDSLLLTFDPNSNDFQKIIVQLPAKPLLGEINPKYAVFINSLNELNNYYQDQLFDKQIQNLKGLLVEQNRAVENSAKRVEMGRKNLEYASKFYKRDSILFAKKVISESELDKTQMSYTANKDAYQNAVGTMINNEQQVKQTAGKVAEIEVQKTEKNKELRIALISSYNDLRDNIKIWSQRYVFKAPFDGRVQFLKFWVDNHFIQNGEPVFSVVPDLSEVMGQVSIPTAGAGKVKPGQEVIVKLDNFPYTEYGVINGIVSSVSLSTNSVKTEKGDVENYLVTVDFPSQLKTNYGTKLDGRLETKGTAEIITKDRKLIERFFDNLKYAIKK